MRDTQDLPAVVGNSDEMDTRNSDEVHCDIVGTLAESNPSHESCTTVSNAINVTHAIHAVFAIYTYPSLVMKMNLHLVCYQKKEYFSHN